MINQDPIAYHIQIDNAFIPVEDAYQPTAECRKLSKEALNYILNRYTILPNRIAATSEEGIYLEYNHGLYRMILEIYNDLTITGIVVDTTKQEILTSEDVCTMNYIHKLVDILLEENNE